MKQKLQTALIFLFIFSYVLEYDYFVYSDTESTVNQSTVNKFFKKTRDLVCNHLNDQENLNSSKCFNTTFIENDKYDDRSALSNEEEITTQLYSDLTRDDLIDEDLIGEDLDDEELNNEDLDYLNRNLKDDNFTSNFNSSLNDDDELIEENHNLTRIQPTLKLLPTEGSSNNHQMLEFDWDLDLAEDKHKWHHKKKKKKKHHHKKKKHVHHHWHWKSKKKCDHHHWHKHKHKEKHKNHHWHKHKHKKESWHKEKHKEIHKHKEWHKHKHKKESWHKHDHKGKHKHDHGHKSKHKHKHDSKKKKKKKKKKGW